jgi:hypothetical protein
MDTRWTATHDIWRILIATAVALALLVTLGAASATAASPTACRVQNTDSGKDYQTPQAAVDAARKGDRLTVRGTCIGGTVIDRNLVIEGINTTTLGKATLSGAGKVRVVETEKGVRVKLRGLVIMRGGVVIKGSLLRLDGYNGHVRGTGILNRGRMILRDILVTRNGLRGACWGGTTVGCDSSGWGAVYNTGSLILNGTSRFSGNWDGVYNTGRLRLNGASIISGRPSVQNGGVLVLNSASRIGALDLEHRGGGVYNSGTLTLNDTSAISGNKGGVTFGGTLVLNDASQSSDNEQGVRSGGTVTLNGSSSIRDNHLPYSYCGGSGLYCWPFNKGGGVYLSGGGSLTLNDSSSISGNSVSDAGGGVYLATFDGRGQVRASLTLNDSSTISGNAALRGGGVWFSPHTATLTGVTCGPGGNVHANTPDDCVDVTP